MTRRRRPLLLAVAGLLAAPLVGSLPTSSASAPGEDAVRPVVRPLVAQGRTTPEQAQAHRPDLSQGPEREPRNPGVPDGNGPVGSGDGALQTSAPTAAAIAGVAENFRGLGVDDTAFSLKYAPPDTNGAVGLTYYVQAVNAQYAVYDKTTGARVSAPLNGSALFAGLQGTPGERCGTRDDGDPIVQYDAAYGRWIFTQFVADAAPYLECVAVSTTDDPRGTYRAFAYAYGNDFPDYPKVGVWPGSYLISYNLFTNASSFAGAEVCAMDRAAMTSGSGVPAGQQCQRTSTSYGGLLPSDVDGATQPPGDAYVVSRSGGSLNTWRFRADWPNASFGMTKVANVGGVASFVAPCTGACVPQLGTSQKLDTLGDRVMYRLAYRNLGTREALVLTHAVNTSTSRKSATIAFRWYELAPTSAASLAGLAVVNQGTYAPDATHRWMSSAAMAKNGSIVVGYSASSSKTYPAIGIASRASGDPAGQLRAESIAQPGGGSQGPNLSRWGDYAAMRVDPADDCSMWFTTEYLTTSGRFNWSTRIMKITPPAC